MAGMVRAAPSARFELEPHPFFWLTQTIGSRDRQLSGALREYGLRVPEYRVLASLCARRHCTMSELSDLSTIDRSTLTRTVERMVEAGWVQRLDDAADLRVRRLGLSARGRQLFDRVWPAVERLNRLAVEGLSAADVATLRALLRRMKQNLERAHDAPAEALTA